MRILLGLILLASCSTTKIPEAPIEMVQEKMDPAYSKVLIFLPDEKIDHQNFFLELRNEKNQSIDIGQQYMFVISRNPLPNYKINRISQGRFQLVFEQEVKPLKGVKFFVQGFPVKKIIENRKKPDPIQGKIIVKEKGDHEITLRLTLKNMQGEGLKTSDGPDIVVEGGGHVFELKSLQRGLWEFKVSLPEENQILYLTVRANGVQLDRLFRYQHVEN